MKVLDETIDREEIYNEWLSDTLEVFKKQLRNRNIIEKYARHIINYYHKPANRLTDEEIMECTYTGLSKDLDNDIEKYELTAHDIADALRNRYIGFDTYVSDYYDSMRDDINNCIYDEKFFLGLIKPYIRQYKDEYYA